MGEKLLTEKELNEVSGGAKYSEVTIGCWIKSRSLAPYEAHPETCDYAYQVAEIVGHMVIVHAYRYHRTDKEKSYFGKKQVEITKCELAEQPDWF